MTEDFVIEATRLELEDAYVTVRSAVDAGRAEQLKTEWRMHPALRLTYSEEPVYLKNRERLEEIAAKSLENNREIPFYFTEEERTLTITDEGPIGTYGGVVWNAVHAPNALLTSGRSGGRIKFGIGHTHPGDYGPGFSHVGEDRGLDFKAQTSVMRGNYGVPGSDVHILLSPEKRLMGIFRTSTDGTLTYHPIGEDLTVEAPLVIEETPQIEIVDADPEIEWLT